MTLVKRQEPNILTPINDIIPIVFASSFSEQNGFRYKIQLLSSGMTEIVSIYTWPDPTNSGVCAYDASMIYKNYLTEEKNFDIYQIDAVNNNIFTYFNFIITEYIGTTSGDTISGSTSKFYLFRGVSDYDNQFNVVNYTCNSGVTGKFLSKWIGDRYYKIGDYGAINVLYGDFYHTSGDIGQYWDRVKITLYSNSNSVLGTYYLKLPAQVPNTGILTIPLGPKNLNLATTNGYIYTSGTTAINTGTTLIDSSVNYYTMNIVYSGSSWNDCSETLKCFVDSNCNQYDGTLFYWLGDLSTNETFKFEKNNSKTFKIKRDEIKRRLQTLNASTGFAYSTGDRERKNVNISTIEEHTAISGWITDDVSKSLMELYRSPEVYVIKNDKLYPIIITSSDIDEKIEQNNGLFNHYINYEMSVDIKNNL